MALLRLQALLQVGLQCLIEVHSVPELERVLQLDLTGCMLGINNRNLETFEVKPSIAGYQLTKGSIHVW